MAAAPPITADSATWLMVRGSSIGSRGYASQDTTSRSWIASVTSFMSLKPLVEGLAFRGVVSAGLDFEALRQIVEVRSGLDQTLAPSVVERMNAVAAEELGQLCDAMAGHSSRNEAFAAEDRAFHLTLASMLSNELYVELVGAFWNVHTRLAPRLGVPTPRDIADTVAAHRAMLDAAIARDLPAYRAAIENHYAPLLRVLDSTSA